MSTHSMSHVRRLGYGYLEMAEEDLQYFGPRILFSSAVLVPAWDPCIVIYPWLYIDALIPLLGQFLEILGPVVPKKTSNSGTINPASSVYY